MIGLMNNPSGAGVDFYAAPPSGDDSQNSEENKEFTEPKQKDEVTYTQDGRRIVNGEVEGQSDAKGLWAQTLLKGSISRSMNMAGEASEGDNDGEAEEEDKSDD